MSDSRQALRDARAAWNLARQGVSRCQAGGADARLCDDALDLPGQLDGDRGRILAASSAVCAAAPGGLTGDPAIWDAALRAMLICLRAAGLIEPGAAA